MALPSGYTELEYIQSSGTQYIDTGVYPNGNTRIVFNCVFAPQSAAVWLFGARGGTYVNTYNFLTTNNLYRSDYGNGSGGATFTTDSDTLEIDKNGAIVTVNGQIVDQATSQSFTSDFSLYLFANNNSGTIQGQCIARLYSAAIYDGDTLLRDYVTCKNIEGVIGLYDLVNNQFYANAGIGTFEAGPEIIPDYGVVALKAAQLTVSDNAIIALDLHVVDPTTGDPLNVTVNSVTGTVNGEAATWQLSGELWVTTVPLSEPGQYLCVFDVATSDGKTVEMRLPLYYGVLSLITDRTQAGVDELLSILQTPFADWTTEQAQLFYSGMSKGAYNASDLNRVGAAMVYIAERMASMGYAVADIAPKLCWMDTDVVTQSDMGAYLSDVASLQAVLPLPDETPTAPSDMTELTFTEANDIEQILLIINTIITNITLAYRYAGELYGGEV